MRGTGLVLVLVLGSFLVAADEPVYSIRLRTFPPLNTTVICHDVDRDTGTVRFLNAAGKVVQEKKLDEQSEEIYKLTVLEYTERAPRKFRQNFSKATSTLVKNNVRSYQGVNVEFLLGENGYRIGLPPKHSVTEEDQESLRQRANGDLEVALDEVFVPSRPIKVGEPWEVDPKLLRRAFAGYGIIAPEKTRGTSQLIKVYNRDGVLFGVLSVKLTIAFSSMDRLKYDPPAIFQIDGQLDTDITGTNNVGLLTLKSTLEGSAPVKKGEVNLVLEIKRQGEVRKERTASSK